ncbi:MAG: hypothetical protein ACRDSE_12630 [Pseudonocardiaceae bacterium]
MTINRACRQDGPTSSTTTDHDGSTLGRLNAIEGHLDEMLIQLDQMRAHLAPLLAELAPAKSEGQDGRND